MPVFDDDDPVAPGATALKIDLSALSIEELEERITTLEAEIARAKAMIASKRQARGAADSVFDGD
jgi:uncharacterized small protein (DUF1192 family)